MGEFLENIIAEFLRQPFVRRVSFQNRVVHGHLWTYVVTRDSFGRWQEIRIGADSPLSWPDAVKALIDNPNWASGDPPDQLKSESQHIANLERRLAVHECLEHEVPDPASCECCAAHDPDEEWKNPQL